MFAEVKENKLVGIFGNMNNRNISNVANILEIYSNNSLKISYMHKEL